MHIKKLLIYFVCFVISFNFTGIDCVHAVSANSAILAEENTGEIIYEKNAHTKLPMASTTKIMTALCVIENTSLEEEITVPDQAIGIEGSSMYLEKGEKITVRELLYGLMLSSGNDAAVALAIHTSSDVESFVKLMNDTAMKIGAKNTYFSNPNGLPHDNHYTTAYDLMLITRYALKYDIFKEIAGTYEKNVSWSTREHNRTLKNHNKLLKMYDGAKGVKTGFTKASGRCLVSYAERGGVGLICVTLNAPDDWNDHISLLDKGFASVKVKNIFKKDSYIATANVINGEKERVELVAKDDVNILIRDNKIPKLNIVTRISCEMPAPVGFGDVAGKVFIYDGDKLIGETEVVTKETIRQKTKPSLKEYFYRVITKFFNLNNLYFG